MSKQHFLVRSKGCLEVCVLSDGRIEEKSVITGEPVRQIRTNAAASRLALGHADGIALVDFVAASNGVAPLCKVPAVCQDFCLSPSGRYLATFEKFCRRAVGESAGPLLLTPS